MNKNIFNKILIALCFIFVFNISNVFAEGESITDAPIVTPSPDTTSPVIKIIGDSEVRIKVGSVYSDAGATAKDDIDGDITSKITASIVPDGIVDTSKIGNYTITYNVSDLAGNNAVQVSRNVIVEGDTVPEVKKEEFTIRSGNIFYHGFIDLPVDGIVNIKDKNEVEHPVSSRSVLAILYSIDQKSEEFSIPGLEYDSGYGSLYLKCLIPNGGVSLCDNWQYVVNDTYPFVGMDKNILAGNEKVYIYFGPQNRVLLSNNSITTNDTLTVTSQKYNYNDNTWNNRTGVTVGVTKPNPNDPWSPNDDIKNIVDENGIATFTNIPEGNYGVGVKEDYYWPMESLSVAKYVAPSNGGDGSSSGGGNTIKEFSTDNAFQFLISKQNSDGSYNGEMYTDWVAIALSQKSGTSKEKIKEYLISNDINSSVLTDYERRAMALMSLGVSPYDGTSFDYIKKIIDSFDGNQFGDPSLINDDIFAILVLKNAGYNTSDEIIKKDISYIINQDNNGSWGSVDMTAALVQALSGLDDVDGVSGAISRANNFILSSSSNLNNPFTASWVMQSGVETSKTNEYINSIQGEDGGVNIDGGEIDSRLWATSYVIPAILNKNWDALMRNFNKVDYSSPSPKAVDNSQSVNTITEPVLFSESASDDFAVSTDKVTEKPIVKTEKVKTNIKKDVISTEEFSNEIEPLNINTNKGLENKGFWGTLGNFWLKLKGIFSWLFVGFSF